LLLCGGPTYYYYYTAHLKWRERVTTGVVLSQVFHRRQPSQLCRQRSCQSSFRVNQSAITPNTTSRTTTSTPSSRHSTTQKTLHIAGGGSACQRVPCSHNLVIAVIRPSSVGIVPVNPAYPNPLHTCAPPNFQRPTPSSPVCGTQPPFTLRSGVRTIFAEDLRV
jgi:hypothetical protein